MSEISRSLSLAFGLAFEDLYRRAGLERVDREFLSFLQSLDAALAGRRALAARPKRTTR